MATEHTLTRVWPTFLWALLAFSVFGALVIFSIGRAGKKFETYESKRAAERSENLKTLREEETKALTTYGWADKETKVARIPVERAMELVVNELKSKPVQPSGVAVPPPVPVSAAPTVVTTPAEPQPSEATPPAAAATPATDVPVSPSAPAPEESAKPKGPVIQAVPAHGE